jgi:hypothetical protein
MTTIEHNLGAEALFDHQVDCYMQLGFTALLKTKDFEDLKDKLLDELENPHTTNFFSIAIPETAIPLNKQLQLAGSRAFLRAENMVHSEGREPEPVGPYLLLDVDDGEDYRGMPAEQANKGITARDRHSFKIVELVSLAIHAPQLWEPPHRGLYAAATLHPEEGQEPSTIDLYRFGDGGLKVKRDPGTISDYEWTTPSYRNRLVVL